ncbi:uncharacterized protein FIBRA_03376 [Fibroporia radiculosa]|uniref:Mid2 domain-containing protein n=1 Tax=Fibroporia radiculosa TaxID=599839 RepID=J4HVY6_9APHY|nr:uncharacterized protein FIBRA_03376 [Fibroporia radiculosa]CCM01327.1 predicted protein [Fibroporia radiculosa]
MQVGHLLHSWLFGLGVLLLVNGQVNVTLQSTASEIVYSPPLCSGTVETCASAWRLIPSPDGSGIDIASTDGPTAASGDLIPQMFLTFTGIQLYIWTSSSSTAMANVSLSTQDPTVSITSQVDTAVGLIAVVDLPGDRATTLTITYINASDKGTRLDFSNLTIVTPSNQTSPFASTILPQSATILPFTPIISAAPLKMSSPSSTQTTSDVVAEVLGAVLGVVLSGLAVIAIRYYRRRRRRPTRTTTGGS